MSSSFWGIESFGGVSVNSRKLLVPRAGRSMQNATMKGLQVAAFNWDAWYESVGGRSIRIEEVDRLLKKIREDQYPRFHGHVNESRTVFPSEDAAAANIKHQALELGADEV